MSRRSEQGSIPAFIIIGILLTAALVGAVVVVRNLQHTGDKVADSSKSSTNETKDSKTTNTTPATDNSKSSNDEALKNALNAQSNADKKTSPNTSSSTSTPAETSTSNNAPSTNTSSLPKTGPESTLISVVGATLLVGTGLAYARSRRLV